MTFELNAATKADLIEYAREELGLKIDVNKTKEDIRQIVASAIGQTVDADAQEDASPAETAEMRALKAQKRVKIRIFENPAHPRSIFVGVNGVSFVIRPGAVVEVPVSVVEALRNATPTTYRQVEEGGKFKMVAQQSQAYPFEILPD